MKNNIISLLNFLFPFQDYKDRPSVFISDTWLEKIMRPSQIKDYLWHSEKKSK